MTKKAYIDIAQALGKNLHFFSANPCIHKTIQSYMEHAMGSSRLSGRFFFLFFFLFLGASTIMCWDDIGYMLHGVFSTTPYNFDAFYGFLRTPAHWLDVRIFHTGYDPSKQQPFPGDNHFGVLFYLLLLLIALIAAATWSILDRRRPDYNRLDYWFRVYLRYMLAMTLFSYGLDKLIPVQMIFPNVESLLAPLGTNNRFSVLWNFMGVSPGYQMVTGTTEIIGALLLFSRRTVALGCIVSLAVLINVVSLNIFYNVTVKLFSMQLLLYTLFLLYPYANRLIKLFFEGQSVSLAAPQYRFRGPLKKYALATVLIAVPLLLLGTIGLGIVNRYNRNARNTRLQKYYEVTTFVAKDTVPPIPTDTLRWKRFMISFSNYRRTPYAVVCGMDDDFDYYEYEIDSIKRTLTLRDGPDDLHRHVFNYFNPAKSQLLLTGKWKDKDVQILMKDTPIDSMWLNKEKIRFIRD
jgi:hypothetical protein